MLKLCVVLEKQEWALTAKKDNIYPLAFLRLFLFFVYSLLILLLCILMLSCI